MCLRALLWLWMLTVLSRETFDADLFVKAPSQSWDITHGGLRPVYGSPSPVYPISPTSPARSEAHDGPSAEDYAAWNRQGALGSLNRYGQQAPLILLSVLLNLRK